MTEQLLYYVCFHNGTIQENLTSKQVNEIRIGSEWYYVGTMEGLELQKKLKKLKKNERLK